MNNPRMIIFFLILIASFFLQSGENEIQIPTIDGNNIEAIISSLDKNNKHPAIVYIHGGAVRERGNPVYGPNNEFLYDITDKIRDMNFLNQILLRHLWSNLVQLFLNHIMLTHLIFFFFSRPYL